MLVRVVKRLCLKTTVASTPHILKWDLGSFAPEVVRGGSSLSFWLMSSLTSITAVDSVLNLVGIFVEETDRARWLCSCRVYWSLLSGRTWWYNLGSADAFTVTVL